MELATPEGQKTGVVSTDFAGSGDAGSGSAPSEGSRTAAAPPGGVNPTQQLLEVVLEKQNLNVALERVEANKGSAGVDGMTTQELRDYVKDNWPQIRAQLLSGEYQRIGGKSPRGSGGGEAAGTGVERRNAGGEGVRRSEEASWTVCQVLVSANRTSRGIRLPCALVAVADEAALRRVRPPPVAPCLSPPWGVAPTAPGA